MAEKLERGDKVKVRLSKSHTLDGEIVEHAAKFVRYHPDGEWADVELDRAHSTDNGRKIFTLSVPVAQLVAALLLLFLFAVPAMADVQYTIPQTLTVTAFNNVSCTGSTQRALVPNLGQATHFITMTNSVLPIGISSAVQGSYDGVLFFDISNAVTITNGLVLPVA